MSVQIKVRNNVSKRYIDRYRFPTYRNIRPYQRIPLRMYVGGPVLGVVQLKRGNTIEAYNNSYKMKEKSYNLEEFYKRVYYDGEIIEKIEDEYLNVNGDPIDAVLTLSYAIQDRVNAFTIDIVTRRPVVLDGHLTAIRMNAELLLGTSYARCSNAYSILITALDNYNVLSEIRRYQLNIMRRNRNIRRTRLR